jgi:hypothetical protein
MTHPPPERDTGDVDAQLRRLAESPEIVDVWDRERILSVEVSTARDEFVASCEDATLYEVTGVELREQVSSRLGFAEYLTRIHANPYDELRTELINAYFAFGHRQGDAGDDERAHAPPVNSDEKTLEARISAWIQAARLVSAQNAKTPLFREHTTASRYHVIVGDKGVGKTFLQNYIISRYCKQFDDAQVLWVRISLARGFHGPGGYLDIDAWVKAQVAKILCRYYDPNSARYKFREGACVFDATAFLDERFRDDPAALRASKQMLTVFYTLDPYAEKQLSYKWLSAEVVDALFSHAVAKGIAFIVVIDGLDLLGRTLNGHASYERTVGALKEYLAAESALWRFHLLFVRPDSLEKIDEHIVQPDRETSEHLRRPEIFSILPVDLEEVYRRRIETLRRPTVATRLAYEVEEVLAFDTFVRATETAIEGAGGAAAGYHEAVARTIGNNTRAAMMILHAATHAFLNVNVEHDKRYRLTERLMLDGMPLPPAAIRYRVHRRGRKESRSLEPLPSGARIVYDTHFLPSLFAIPFDGTRTAVDVFGGDNQFRLLMGLRVLQTAALLDRSGNEDPTEAHLQRVVRRLFGYRPEEVEATISRQIDDELLVFRKRAIRYSLPWLSALHVGTKGRMLLDEYVCDATYLSLAALTAFLPVSVCLFARGRPRILVTPVTPAKRAVDYVMDKVINAVTLSKLVKELSRRQEEFCAREIVPGLDPELGHLFGQGLAEITPRHRGYFDFTARMESEVLAIARLSVMGLLPHERQEVCERIEGYLRH